MSGKIEDIWTKQEKRFFLILLFETERKRGSFEWNFHRTLEIRIFPEKG